MFLVLIHTHSPRDFDRYSPLRFPFLLRPDFGGQVYSSLGSNSISIQRFSFPRFLTERAGIETGYFSRRDVLRHTQDKAEPQRKSLTGYLSADFTDYADFLNPLRLCAPAGKCITWRSWPCPESRHRREFAGKISLSI